MTSSETVHVHLLIKGRVQGVGFRFFAQAAAAAQHLQGWVRNRPGGDVEAEAEGPRMAIEAWIEQVRKGTSIARVDDIQTTWLPDLKNYNDFSIR